MLLRGVLASLPTPFDHVGDIYVPKVRYNLGLLNQTALSGYIVGGAEGEGELLSRQERIALWETAADACGDKLLVPMAGTPSVHETLELLTQVAQMGLDTALIEIPSGCGVELGCAEGQALFVRSVADASPLPLIVSSGDRLEPDLLGSLGKHPRIVAIRVMTEDADYLRSCLAKVQGSADIIVGCASLLTEGLTEGAAAAMVSFAAVAPYLCLSIEEAVRTREFGAARDLQGTAIPAVETIRKHGIAGLKAAADLQGYYGGVPRLPLTPLAPSARAEIEATLRSIKS